MSFGWEHYCEYKLSIICGFNCRPRTTVLLFRRPLGTDGRTGLVDPVRSKELKEKFRRDYGLEWSISLFLPSFCVLLHTWLILFDLTIHLTPSFLLTSLLGKLLIWQTNTNRLSIHINQLSYTQYKMRQDGCIAGTGFILLFLWIIVIINVFMSPSRETVNDWHKRLEPFHMGESSYAKNNDMVLVLSTTVMPTDVRISRFFYFLGWA